MSPQYRLIFIIIIIIINLIKRKNKEKERKTTIINKIFKNAIDNDTYQSIREKLTIKF